MMRKLFKLSLLILLSIKGIHVYSQDSLSKKGAIDISTSLWGLAFITPKNPSIIIPNSLLIRRTLYNNSTTKPDKKITDNPLEHAPMYFALHSKTTISEGIYLNADLYAEHRGISYGVYNTKNMVVYPVLNFNINDTLALLKQKIYVKFSALHLLNERLDNGLYIYNVDVQGAKLNLSHGNLLLEASMYGDLSNGIGLKIDDLYNLKIQKAISKTQSFGISLSVDYGFFKKLFQDNYLNVLYNYSKNNHSVYAQVGFRLLNANNKFSEKLAYVTGYQLEKSFLKHSHKLGVEVRYYGRTFNSNRFDDSLRFRDADKPI
ncbi:MAG: hypothetical protein JWQ96_2536, partial [Segetibacter sp.]|nr:hypothetical protein [Segetibacter sp.]